jgi:ribonuclease PH
MRKDRRENNQFRPVVIEPDFVSSAAASALYTQNDTKVLCTAFYDTRLPYFVKESGKGWVAAEYAMLPGSTGQQRAKRERQWVNNRNIEIQRFLGRALRNSFNLKLISEFMINIDTDVIQADGSTRCASLNGGMVVLVRVLKKLVYENLLKELPEIEVVSAVSVGVLNGELLVDLTYEEDSTCEADITVVSSEKGRVVEVMAFAEENPISRELMHQAIDLGVEKNFELIEIIKKHL